MQIDSISRPTPLALRALLHRMAHSCEVQLCVYGGVSAFVYWLAFTRAYSLNEWWVTSQRTIAKLAHFEMGAGISYTLGFLALFILYFLALRCAKFEATPRVLATVTATTVLLNLPLLLLYPVDSADIFDNIIRGRMTSLYGLNPFLQVPHDVIQDPFYFYTAWRFFPSAYGPLWELVASAGAWFAGNSVIGSVLVFKLISVASYLGIGGLVVKILEQVAPARAAYGAVFVLWNPLLLYTTAGNGHNDAVMMFTVVLAFYFLTHNHFTFAIVALVAGMLVKFIPALLIPVVLLAAWNALHGWRERVRYFAVTGFVSASFIAVAYAPFWDGKFLDLDWRWNLFTTSLPAWAWLALENFYDPKFASALVNRGGYILLAAWMLREMILLWRHRAEPFRVEPYVRAALSILLFYLLVTVAWFQTWYVVWLIPLAALLPDGFVTRGVLVFCGAALWKMPLYDFVLFRDAPPAPRTLVNELVLTLGVLAAPWLYFASGIRKRGKQSK